MGVPGKDDRWTAWEIFGPGPGSTKQLTGHRRSCTDRHIQQMLHRYHTNLHLQQHGVD